MFKRLTIAILALLMFSATAQAYMVFSSGSSEKRDIAEAMTDAANAAKKGLSGKSAKLVLVSVITRDKKVNLSPIFAVFPKDIVFGSSNAGVITTDKVIDSGVAVLAFGGDVAIRSAVAALDKKGDGCGKQLGEQLKLGPALTGSQQLCIMAGDCHHPKNNSIAKGVLSVTGDKMPIVGAAADGPKLVIYKGEIRFGAAIAVLLSGNFKCGFGMAGSGARDPKSLVAIADQSVSNAVAENKPELLLMFDCAGRRRALRKGNAIGREFAVIKKHAGAAAIFGFYGQGEVGKKSKDEVSFGSGYHVSTCSISVPKE